MVCATHLYTRFAGVKMWYVPLTYAHCGNISSRKVAIYVLFFSNIPMALHIAHAVPNTQAFEQFGSLYVLNNQHAASQGFEHVNAN